MPPWALLGAMLSVLCSAACIPLGDSSKQGRPLFSTGDYQRNEPEPEPTITTPVRPNGLFHIKPDYCLCQSGRSAMYQSMDHCDAVCSDATGGDDQSILLLGQVEVVDPQLAVSFEFFQGSLNNFCNALIDPSHERLARCFGRYTERHSNRSSEQSISEITIQANNRFAVVFSNQLRKDKIYRFRIQARSEFIHPETTEVIPVLGHTDFIEFKVSDNTPPPDLGGLLRVGMTKRYLCLLRTLSSSDQLGHVFKQHFIFDQATPPPPIPKVVPFITCHNEALGYPDSPFFPRLHEQNAFRLWDKTDRRFYRSDKSQSEIDINESIKTRLLEQHQIDTIGEINLFNPLALPSFPGISTVSTSSAVNNLAGFYLKVFVDPEGGDYPICPDAVDLNRHSGDKKFDRIFSVLSEFIGATEALYVAHRTPRQFDPINNNPIDDIFFINEGTLKTIWFYRNDVNQPQFLDVRDSNFKSLVATKAIYFYWPSDPRTPTVKKPQQSIYKIRTLAEIQTEIDGNSTPSPSQAPHIDRRIGCIPRMGR